MTKLTQKSLRAGLEEVAAADPHVAAALALVGIPALRRREPGFETLLRDHFDREENGLFPASAIELADGAWERVHELTPPAA
ncbi:MAG: hypothetical protein KDB44_02490 [Mycobacterium sp.]|nr:hypothetical protein [Mycobacterium sp.]